MPFASFNFASSPIRQNLYCLCFRDEKAEVQLKKLTALPKVTWTLELQFRLWFAPKSVLSLFGFSGGSDIKESASNVGDLGLILGSERSPGEGNGYPFWYSCLENLMDRGAWWTTVLGVAKSLKDWVTDTFIFPQGLYYLICLLSLADNFKFTQCCQKRKKEVQRTTLYT